MAKFEAEITANVDGFVKNLSAAEKKANEFASSSTTLNNKSSQAFNKTSSSIDKFSNATGQANSVAMEFNRIIQDAPFGMMGIGNNIQQLTANFGSLKSATGSTGAALKATFASILSSGNLLALGVAAITSGWTLYNMWQQRSKKSTEETKSSIDELTSSLSLQSNVMVQAAKSSGQELAQLRVLYQLTQDVTKSTNERTSAANKLIKQYPDLFGNFNKEEILLGKSKSAYDKLSASILATAKAQAAYGKIGEKFAEQIAIDEQNNDLRTQLELERKVLEQRKKSYISGQPGSAYSSVNVITTNEYGNALDKVAGIEEKLKNNLLDRAKLQEQINNLESIAVVNQGKIIENTNNNTQSTSNASSAQKDYRRELIESLAQMGYYDAALGAIGYKYQELSKLAQQAGASAKDLGRIAREELGEKLSLALGQSANIDPTKNISLSGILNMPDKDAISAQMKAYGEIISKEVRANIITPFDIAKEQIGQTLGDGFVSIISNSFSALGDAIANGGDILGAVGKSIISTLGGLAKSIGEQMIAFGTAGLALKFMVKNPLLSIAAGAALVALGSFAQSSVNKQVSNVGSGGYSQSSVSSNVVSGGMNTGPLYNNDRQVVELRLRNTDLVGALNNNQNRNNRLS